MIAHRRDTGERGRSARAQAADQEPRHANLHDRLLDVYKRQGQHRHGVAILGVAHVLVLLERGRTGGHEQHQIKICLLYTSLPVR